MYDCYDVFRCWVLKVTRGWSIFRKMLLVLKDINGNVHIFKEKISKVLYKNI